MSNRLELPPIFQERVVVFDGAMGSLLAERGVSYSHPFEELNLSSPHLVCQVHADYIKAGADVIETNTFAANRFKLARHGLENRVTEINLAGARLARSVAGRNAFVAGSIGPMGVRISPIGTASIEDIKNATLQQLNGLVEGEVDLIILETQSDVQIACIMLECITQSCSLPIICQFALDMDLATPGGDTLDDIAARLSSYPLSAIGVNCGIGPEQTLRAVQYLREITDFPISAQPNSGFPAQVEGRTLFLSNPEYFAERGAEIVSAGASIVGGCCGTSPAHIEKLAAAVKNLPKPLPCKIREPRPRLKASSTDKCAVSPLLRRMNGNFVTVEVTPPKDTNYLSIIDKLRPLVKAGISAVDITDNPMAHVHMSGIAFAHLVKEKLGIAAILHLTCRDLNLLGIHSALLGADVLGIDGILALTGDPASVGDYPHATSVFDVTSDGLAKIISSLNCGLDFSGKEIGKPTNFAIGGAFNPNADDINKELERLRRKREAGVNFLMTQPIFDLSSLYAAAEKLPNDWNPPILVGVLPLRSLRHAQFLHNEVPGITIPENILKRLAESDSEASAGLEIAREIYKAASRDFGGIYFMPAFGNFNVVLDVMEIKV